MIEIKIQEASYEIPTEWKDMTVEYWCGLYAIINQYNKRDKDGKVIEEDHSEVQLLKMNRDIFMYLTGLTQNEMEKLDVDSVNTAITAFSGALEEYKPKGIDRFEFEDEVYLFPKEFLKRSTFGDYIESTHLESTIDIMKHGRFDVLPEQMAILCRKAGEEYDDDVIPSKTDKFKKLTMDLVWEFSFFDNAKRKINKDFPNVFGKNRGGSGSGKNKVSTIGLYNKFIKPYGWLNSLYMVAEKGVFRMDSENDIESVKKTDLYKVLTYLSWNSAKNDYEIAVQEKIHNKNNITL